MEGGLALMWFRMLFWVCSLALVFSQDNTGPTATVKILPEYTTEPREGDSVTLDCEISSNQQPEYVLWARRTSLHDSQTYIVDETGLTAFTDSRFSVSPLQVVNSTAALYSHKITIDPVQQSDQGYYQCLVTREPPFIVQSTETPLFVHRSDEFPVCFPDGPATVSIASSLSCKTLSNTRIPIVFDIEMPTASNDGWVTSPTNGGGSPGQELIKTVTNSEHGKTHKCFSTSNDSAMALVCSIGPLTVVSESTKVPSTHEPTKELTMTDTSPTTVQVQTSTSKSQNFTPYIAVLIVSIVIHLITIILLFLCCQYDPRRWQQLGGMLRRSSTPRQGNDLEVDYEVPPEDPRTATPSTMSPPPKTAKHIYHNVIPVPTSSSKQSEDSYMELNPPEQKPVYSELKL